MNDTYTYSQRVLSELAAVGHSADYYAVAEHKGDTIPACPQGYQLYQDLTFASPFYNLEAHVQFSIVSEDRILLCHAIDAPQLAKPALIETIWLHLHLACLIAAERHILPVTNLKSKRLLPCIPRLKPQPDYIFPLAFYALHSSIGRDVDDLPF